MRQLGSIGQRPLSDSKPTLQCPPRRAYECLKMAGQYAIIHLAGKLPIRTSYKDFPFFASWG
ncbi:hypothetical protein OKW39_008520 [Paraburkholderia sp. MM6662-R1]